MEILKAFKFRLYPTEEQKTELAIQFGHARFVYNASLDLHKDCFFMAGASLSYEDMANALTEFKRSNADLDWLKQANAQVLQQSLKDLDKAFQNFFRNHKNGTLPPPGKHPRKDGMPNGYPIFKRKFDKQSIRFPQDFKLEGSKIYLPKVGWVKVRRHRQTEGEMKNATVSKTKTGKYFVSIQCKIETDIQPVVSFNDVGIDLGLKDFAILNSDAGTEPKEAPKPLRTSERLLKLRQRRLSRKGKKSNGRNKARLRVAATHEKISNRRKDFHHKLSRKIVTRFDGIGLETLNVKGMVKNHHLAKSISDAGWSQFVTFIEYKAAWAGIEVVRYDRWYPSSKTCNDCGYVNRELKLSDRTWVCPNCGVIHDRDENAAKNLRPFQEIDSQICRGVPSRSPRHLEDHRRKGTPLHGDNVFWISLRPSTAGVAGINAGWDARKGDTSSVVKRSAPEKSQDVQLTLFALEAQML